MLELSPARKNKVNLTDYPCQQDIENRMLMADFGAFDVEVLEEILFSPLKISVKKLARNLECDEPELLEILKKFSRTGLLVLQDDTVVVDKERRKYFESQISRFEPDFKPDMEYLQGILKKAPIHVLPIWYSIPRSSNNIFESIVEKYLLSPQTFHRYLVELNLGAPVLNGIIQDVFSAPDFKVASSDLIAKYNLIRRDFEEMLLLLEFNFVCCLTFEKEDDHWLEYVVPFYEWHQYLRFLNQTEAPTIDPSKPVSRFRESDFAFIEDLTVILETAKRKPIPLSVNPENGQLSLSSVKELAALCHIPLEGETAAYLSHLVEKLCLVKLADRIDEKLYALEPANDWLDLSRENQALHLYRHSLNRILTPLPVHIATERNVREAEKAIKRVLHGEWVFFEEFFKGVLVALNEDSVVMLKRTGKHWKYTLPTYGEEEKALVKATVFEWLFETGMVAIGSCEGRECFSVTPFGRFFFEG